jgi:hypothetical protein
MDCSGIERQEIILGDAFSAQCHSIRCTTYDATIRDALVALWEASDRICGKRLKVMIPTLLPSLERQ